MWVGVLSAIIVDITPKSIRTTVIAIYLFIITIIGGNMNLIVTPLMSAFSNGGKPSYATMQWTLLIAFPGFYVLSSILFVLAFVLMRFDIKMKKKIDEGGQSLYPKSGSFVDSQ